MPVDRDFIEYKSLFTTLVVVLVLIFFLEKSELIKSFIFLAVK